MQTSGRGVPLHLKIFAGLAFGAAAGALCQALLGYDHPGLQAFVKDYAQPIGQLFLRLIFMIVVPLLFSALVLGVAEIGDARRVGRVGMRSLLLTVVLSSLAVILGLTLVNLIQPGAGIDPERRNELMQLYAKPEDAAKSIEQGKQATSWLQTLVEIVPRNPITESARALEGGLLPFMFFALVFGIAMASVEAEKTAAVKAFLEGVFAISIKVIEFAMRFAPVGVFALVFSTTAVLGLDAIAALGKYVLLVLFALAFHQFGVYSLTLKLLTRRTPIQFFRQIRSVMLTAFATSSSNATLPTALRSAQEDVGLPRDVSSFVLTIGATGNQNGTALFEGITILFLAQFFGVDLTLSQQLTVMGMAIVAGVGTAGVPGGAWPMIAIILQSVGVQPEAIGIALGIDRILDMSRTVLNVSGDIVIAACVSDWEARSEAKG